MKLRTVLLVALLSFAGCLGSADDGSLSERQQEDDQPPEQPTATRSVERVIVFQGNVSGGTEAGPVGVNGTHVLGSGLASLHLSLTWTETANAFEAQAEGPAGRTTVAGPSGTAATSAEAEVADPKPGLWRFEIVAQGPHVPDEVRLEVTGTWEVPAEAGAAEATIHTEQRGERWIAWRNVTDTGSVEDEVTVEAHTTQRLVNVTNGPVQTRSQTSQATASGDQQRQAVEEGEASVLVHVWARGDSEEQARERVRSVNATASVASDRVEGKASASSWEERGADVHVLLPEDTSAYLDLSVTNGQLNAFADQVTGGELTTTNGPIRAQLSASGDLEMSSTNGLVAADVHPTASLDLLAETVNGRVDLGLLETDEIGYEIDGQTTHGRLSEDMAEAELYGSEQQATLRTDGYDDRSIQVTGLVETTNGDVAFAGR